MRHARSALEDVAAPAGTAPTTGRTIRAAALVGPTNPKAFIVFAAILPQFVDRSAGHVSAQMLVLGLVPVLMGGVTDSAWGLAAGQARTWLGGSPRRTAAVGRAGGLSMIGLGVSVAVTGHRN